MKKIITSILALAALVGCSKVDNAVVNNADNITFGISATMPQTRTELVNTNGSYGAIWKAGDTFSIIEVGDGANKQNGTSEPLTEDAATIAAKVTVKAKTYGKYEYFFASPKASMNGACTYMAMTLPAAQAPSSMTTFDGAADFLIGKPVEMSAQPLATDVLNFEIARMSAIGKVTVKGVTLAADDKVTAVKITFSQLVSGKITKIMTDNLRAGTYPQPFEFDASASNYVSVTLPEPQTGEFTYYMCCWPQIVAASTAYTVELTTEKGATITKNSTIPADLVFSAGDITSFTINMAATGNEPSPEPEPEPTEKPDYITVAGIKWAAGNLEYEKDGATDTGFAAGWAIAPTQYHHFYTGITGDVNGEDKRNSYDKSAHFNFGGIENPFTYLIESVVAIEASDPAFDFSGKMYTDKSCTAATTDFAAAKFGDIAYWASNGKYRMPTATEFQKLYDEACRIAATYTVGTSAIKGTYYYNPGQGESAGAVEGTKELTADDLKVGIFLPWSGRGYNKTSGTNTEWGIFKVNSQGVYRTSTVNKTSTAEATNGVIYRVQSLSEGAYYNAAYGAEARYCVRPVYVE